MRRSLRLLGLLAAILALLAAGLGFLPTQEAGSETAAAGGADQEDVLVIAHAVAGHAAVLLALGVAAMAFLIGLHGLLEAGGQRRLRSALLLAVGPILTGLALAALLSALAGIDAASGDSHNHVVFGLALAAGAVLACGAAWLFVRPHEAPDDAP